MSTKNKLAASDLSTRRSTPSWRLKKNSPLAAYFRRFPSSHCYLKYLGKKIRLNPYHIQTSATSKKWTNQNRLRKESWKHILQNRQGRHHVLHNSGLSSTGLITWDRGGSHENGGFVWWLGGLSRVIILPTQIFNDHRLFLSFQPLILGAGSTYYIYPLVNKHSNGKPPFFNRKYIFKWWIFHCYVRLPECIWFL